MNKWAWRRRREGVLPWFTLLKIHTVTFQVIYVRVLALLFSFYVSARGPISLESPSLSKNAEMYKTLVRVKCLLEMCQNSLVFAAFHS